MTDTQGATATPAVKRIDETDSYTAAVAGATVHAVRIGEGPGPNLVLGLPDDRLTVTSSEVGFPICTHSHVPEGHVITAFIEEVVEPSRWCGVSLRPGLVVVYAPGVEHTAINRPGLRFHFGITPTDDIEELADRLGTPIRVPSHGEVVAVEDADRNRRLGEALTAHTRAALAGRRLRRTGDDVMRAMTVVLGEEAESGVADGRGLDSKSIVHECLDYVEAEERIPSIEELCRVAFVSERRLRGAFVEEFDLPPSRFLRSWALDRARRRLLDGEQDGVTVTEIAAGLGFSNLGRFAGQYRTLYGESPAVTLYGPGLSRAS